jgi:hypothetical protein
MAKTSYLAAALTNALIDSEGACDLGELAAQMEDYYEGEATQQEIERELDLLERADSVESFHDENGVQWYRDAS